MKEIRKDIKWYEWKYQVSNLWRVKSLWKKTIYNWWYRIIKEKILKPSISTNWYYHIGSLWTVHRLIIKSFIPNTNNKKTVNHKDGNKLNNNLDNLERVTYSENHKHAFKYLWKNVWNKWLKWLNIQKKWKFSCFAKKVWQYDLEWNLIKERWSQIDVKRELWFHPNSVCKWYRKTAWGFIWKYI